MIARGAIRLTIVATRTMFKKRTIDKTNIRKREGDDDGRNVKVGVGGETETSFQNYAIMSADMGTSDAVSAAVAAATAAAAAKSAKPSLVGGSTRGAGMTAVSIGVAFESDKDAKPAQHAGHATYTSEIDTATDRDARAILERSILQQQEEGGKQGTVYRGQAAYDTTFTKKDLTQVLGSSKVTGTQGPIRAPTFLHASTRFDYQPDICKDYKDTGFCGYGDSCKFLHDRGDYKSGWQQEKEWDEQQAKKKKRLEDGMAGCIMDEDGNIVGSDPMSEGATDAEKKDAEKDALPFACLICRGDFKNPVVTSCGHYFCSACILESNKKSLKCPAPACGKQTFGVFNKATKLIKKSGSSSCSSGGGGGDGGGSFGGGSARGQWEDI